MCVASGHLVISERWDRVVIPTLSCTRRSSFGGPAPVLARQLWLRTLRTPVYAKCCASLSDRMETSRCCRHTPDDSRAPLILVPDGRSKCRLPHTGGPNPDSADAVIHFDRHRFDNNARRPDTVSDRTAGPILSREDDIRLRFSQPCLPARSDVPAKLISRAYTSAMPFGGKPWPLSAKLPLQWTCFSGSSIRQRCHPGSP
jgi:hypothetical protein